MGMTMEPTEVISRPTKDQRFLSIKPSLLSLPCSLPLRHKGYIFTAQTCTPLTHPQAEAHTPEPNRRTKTSMAYTTHTSRPPRVRERERSLPIPERPLPALAVQKPVSVQCAPQLHRFVYISDHPILQHSAATDLPVESVHVIREKIRVRPHLQGVWGVCVGVWGVVFVS